MAKGLILSVFVLLATEPSMAQTTDAGADRSLSPSLAAVAKTMHATIRRNIAEAAERMPAEDYAYKPTPQVRSFAEVLGHIANANFFFCSQAQAQRSPSTTNLETVTEKALLVKVCSSRWLTAIRSTTRRLIPISISRSRSAALETDQRRQFAAPC
jgi:hypothetical protein